MQSILVNPNISKDNILTMEQYISLTNVKEYLLYADNVLEGITLLNDLTMDSNYLKFVGVLYEPIDQPVYVFKDDSNCLYSIKICGAYDKWDLPKEVSEIKQYVDLPDYIFYSINNQKVILAGENTETASVGNSQWQREGRKLGAARLKVPFIYQTFYSGRDESQDTIREPSSLQVFNQLVYSVRYKTPSIVSYFENNFENSTTRNRDPIDSKTLFSNYIKTVLLSDANIIHIEKRKEAEKRFFIHMIDYIKEKKYQDIDKENKKSRIYYDLPSLKDSLLVEILENTNSFVEKLIEYIYEENDQKISQYLDKCDLLNLDENKFEKWTSYKDKNHINKLIKYLSENNDFPLSYVKGSAKVGFAKTENCNRFLKENFSCNEIEIDAILDSEKYPRTVIMPLRIHKVSNGNLTFSPDPESGEIVAFSELFSFDINRKKKRPVIGYCTVDTPNRFNILDKKGTKLFKAISQYVDILILNGNELITSLQNEVTTSNYVPRNILSTKPLSITEEVAIVSTYLNQSTINSSWKLCFIHTHHSSWQQLVIHDGDREIQQKIDRVSTKVDLIMQKNNQFMIAEGKKSFGDIIADPKIKAAMIFTSNKINELYRKENFQFDAFIYNLITVPNKDPDFYVQNETQKVQGAITRKHFDNIANHDSFVVIIVYLNEENKTRFKLVYSKNFDFSMKAILDEEFNQ